MDNKRIGVAISLYSRFFLSVYDWYVIFYNHRVLWKCPSYNLLNLYNKYVSDNHLDIGVGNGYFMDKCKFPSQDPKIALLDLNQNSLDAAAKRLARYKPRVYIGNALEKFNLDNQNFDSIGMMNLLHCLPGDMTAKGVVFDNAKEVLNDGGVIFGSTILYKGVRRSPLTTFTLKWCNKKGIMTNLEDDINVLKSTLKEKYSESDVEIIGCMALFWAIK